MAAFFGVFLVAGLGFLMFFLWPAVKVVRAQSWMATKCEVERSWVESHSGEDGATYSIEVRYRYEVDGVEYAGDRYEFMGGSSSGHDSKQKIVDRLSSGSVTPCYYDPDDPASSVLHRGFSWVYLFGLLPLVFVAVGAGGMYWAWSSRKKKVSETEAVSWDAAGVPSGGSRLGAAGAFREIDEWSTPVVESGPIELEESLGPVGKLVGLIFISLFWNGIVSVFVWQAWQAWRSEGEFEAGCLSLFLVPFVLIGLAMLVGIPYQFLALANPRPKLTLSRAGVPLGGTAQLTWSFRGAAGRLRRACASTSRAPRRRGTGAVPTRTPTPRSSPRSRSSTAVKACRWGAVARRSGCRKTRCTRSRAATTRSCGSSSSMGRSRSGPTSSPSSRSSCSRAGLGRTDLIDLRVELGRVRGELSPRRDDPGNGHWSLVEAPEALEVRLFWFTQGKGDQDVGVVETTALDGAGREGSRDFSFTAPAAPLSFSGKLISLLWAVELVALPKGDAGRQELVISWTGREILIGSEEDGALEPPG